MVNALSKLSPITTTCCEYVHPWTQNCWIATAELLLYSAQHSLRIYTAVYTLSLLMRGRIPTWNDIKRTILGITQSSAFLSTNAFSYSMFLCIIRKYVGTFNFYTVSYVPAFMAAAAAIIVERPSRRGLLSLYVANVATETLWRMGVARNIVTPLKYGQVIIFGLSSSILIYFFRSGQHLVQKDSLFDILRFVVGKSEERTSIQVPIQSTSESRRNGSSSRNVLPLIGAALKIYNSIINKIKELFKHKTCPHNDSCAYYTVQGGTKLFMVGLGLQIVLKMVFGIKKIINNSFNYKKVLLSRDTMKLGIFLGGFSSLFRLSSCILRHTFGYDTPAFAIPAGLIASTAFSYYPDNSVALYIMWKALQITYNILEKKGYVPKVPAFTSLLYCASTALLFHAATIEPTSLRPSYWIFLHSISGGRIANMDRNSIDYYGLKTTNSLKEVMKKTQTSYKLNFHL